MTSNPRDNTTRTRIIEVPDIAWVEIPTGDVLYGKDSDQRALRPDTFWIARYPITNSQYQTFIDDGGYDDERW